jgi:hypothetical protein
MLAGTRHANVWEETAVAPPPVPPLEGSQAASVLVIGAGYLGLSAALHLAEAGVDVLVADAEMPGWGASGRNGGQVIPGLKHDPSELEVMFGRERGTRIWQFAGAAADFVLDLVSRLALNCSARRATWIQGIHSEKAAARAQKRVDDWTKRGARVEYSIARAWPRLRARTSTSGPSPTTAPRRCSRCRMRASWRVRRSQRAHVSARVHASSSWREMAQDGGRLLRKVPPCAPTPSSWRRTLTPTGLCLGSRDRSSRSIRCRLRRHRFPHRRALRCFHTAKRCRTPVA